MNKQQNSNSYSRSFGHVEKERQPQSLTSLPPRGTLEILDIADLQDPETGNWVNHSLVLGVFLISLGRWIKGSPQKPL